MQSWGRGREVEKVKKQPIQEHAKAALLKVAVMKGAFEIIHGPNSPTVDSLLDVARVLTAVAEGKRTL